MLLEYTDCPWFIDFLLQELAQLSANREKFVSAICFGTFEADNFYIPCSSRGCFLFFFCECVSSTHVFASVYVDLSVGAAVSSDSSRYNEKGGGRGRSGDREKNSAREGSTRGDYTAGRVRDSQTERWFRSTRNTQL